MARDTIEVQGLRVDCVLGVRSDERDREQSVRVDLRLLLDLAPAGISASIGDTIDYDRVSTEVAAMLRFRRYRLLENAAAELSAMLLGVHPALQALELRLAKPEALLGRAELASIVVARTRDDFPSRIEVTRFGEVERLLETKEAALHLLHVAPGTQLPPEAPHELHRTLTWVVHGQLWQGDEAVLPFRPREHEHAPRTEPALAGPGYRNGSDAVATLFRCECPPLEPAEEHERAPLHGAAPLPAAPR